MLVSSDLCLSGVYIDGCQDPGDMCSTSTTSKLSEMLKGAVDAATAWLGPDGSRSSYVTIECRSDCIRRGFFYLFFRIIIKGIVNNLKTGILILLL